MTEPFIPISTVTVTSEQEQMVLDVLRSGHLAQGPRVEELETLFAQVSGAEHAVAVSSGTAALFLALEALRLGPGDEVITSPFTFVATLNAILAAGATARFADIGDDYNVDPASIESLINERTAAILPVHLYGCPADMSRIEDLAARHGLPIIEDAAQAVGARVGDRPVGSWGTSCFSLYATKNVTTAEGGVVTTNDAAVADKVRLLRNQGMRARYEYETLGYNFRLTDLQAALGIPQMHALDSSTKLRRENAAVLAAGLEGVVGLTIPHEPDDRFHVWHQFTVRVDDAAGVDRETLAKRIHDRGIGSGIYYPKLVHDYAAFRGNPAVYTDPTPTAAAAASRVLSLPVHPGVGGDGVERVVSAVRAALEG